MIPKRVKHIKILGIPVRLVLFDPEVVESYLGYFRTPDTGPEIGICKEMLKDLGITKVIWAEILHAARYLLTDGHMKITNNHTEEHLIGQMSTIVDSVLRDNPWLVKSYSG